MGSEDPGNKDRSFAVISGVCGVQTMPVTALAGMSRVEVEE